MGFTGKKLRILSLGSGQVFKNVSIFTSFITLKNIFDLKEEKAREMIKECCQTPTWVVLLNCHLVPDWMDELEYLCEDLCQDSTNQVGHYQGINLHFWTSLNY
jgi:hypothetical protein